MVGKNKLNKIDEDIWEYEYTHHKPPLHVRMRMVVVRFPSGGLWLYSPNPIDQDLLEELAIIGIVEHIIFPNCFHDLFFKKIQILYPKAKLWAAPGLVEKRKDLLFDGVLSKEKNEWPEIFDSLCMEGTPRSNEVVFFHKSSKSLICADLIFNINNENHQFMKIIWKLLGVWQKTSQNRGWKFMTKNKKSSKIGVDQILNWNIKRVVMAHGDILYPTEGQLKSVFSWLDG